MTALITLRNVHMRYSPVGSTAPGAHEVLAGLSFGLSSGERLGVVGRNGAGKSTLLKVMARIFAPASGEVTWGPGVTVALLSLGLGFRDDLSGRENAYLSAILQGFRRTEARYRVAEIESFCELDDAFDAPVKTYSSGMRARLGFASALLNDAQVLLVDEVLAVGDHAFRAKARQALLQKLNPERGVVVVSHSDQQIENLCNRAIWLEGGGIAASGEPAAVLEAYNGAV